MGENQHAYEIDLRGWGNAPQIIALHLSRMTLCSCHWLRILLLIEVSLGVTAEDLVKLVCCGVHWISLWEWKHWFYSQSGAQNGCCKKLSGHFFD